MARSVIGPDTLGDFAVVDDGQVVALGLMETDAEQIAALPELIEALQFVRDYADRDGSEASAAAGNALREIGL